MKLKNFLSKEHIICTLEATDKIVAIKEILSKMGKMEALKVLLEREKLGSTGIGSGVAIPHARERNLHKVHIGFGRSVQGIPFEAADGKDVNFVIVLLAPEIDPGKHLQVLARISKIFKAKNFRDHLLNAASEKEIYELLINEDEKYS